MCFYSVLWLTMSVSLCSPDSWVLSVADGRELLSEEWVHFGVDGNQLTQSLGSPEPHRTARVLQGLQEGGLQLRQEGLQGNAHLEERATWLIQRLICGDESVFSTVFSLLHVWHGETGADLRQQQGESLQQSRLHRPGKAVSQDTNERSGDVDDRRPQCLGRGQFDDAS